MLQLRTKSDPGTADTRWDQGTTAPPHGAEVPATTSRLSLVFTPVDGNGDPVAHSTSPTADVRIISYETSARTAGTDTTILVMDSSPLQSGLTLEEGLIADDMTPGSFFTVWMGQITGLTGGATGIRIDWAPLR